MKYLPLSSIDHVNTALNFSTADLHVIGGCDIYTTKAAGSDKKLYRAIEDTLESQYANLVRLSASLSPPYRTAAEDLTATSSTSDNNNNNLRRVRSHTPQIPTLDLSRASPFGPLSKPSSRRTFAYLIATLNASHPDYDFSHILRPTDFRKERSLRSLAANVDSTLYNLRPRSALTSYLAPPTSTASASRNAMPIANGFGNEVWGPRMWNLIDDAMGLKNCERYSYLPQDDAFDGEEGAIWSMHYFFFNRERKRVCYLYLRGLSVLGHSPVMQPVLIRQPRGVSVHEGAGKRASYWLGSGLASDKQLEAGGYEDDDDEAHPRHDVEMVIDAPGDDEVEVPPDMDLDEVRDKIGEGYYEYDYDYDNRYAYGGVEPYDEKEDFEGYEGWTSWDSINAGRRGVRGVSEEVGDMIEV